MPGQQNAIVDSQAKSIRAIGLTVSNIERSRNFYTAALGFEFLAERTVTSDLTGLPGAEIRILGLRLGDERIELIQYLHRQGKPIPADSQSNDRWFQHLAIVVRDMQAAYDHLCAFEFAPISTEPQTFPSENKEAAGTQAFKFKDPDGHDLELICFPPDKGQSRWHQPTERLFLGIDHSAMTIASTEQSLQFYRDCLGLRVAGGSLNWQETQSRLDGVDGAEVQVTSLRPVQGGLGIELLEYLAPAGGRPIPTDWQSCDIAHMQIELVVDDLEQMLEKLQRRGVGLVSPGIVPLPDCYRPFRRGCQLKDPDGHALVLITQ